jgi:hypothetical protein
MAEPSDKELRRYQRLGALGIVLGIAAAIGGSLIAHFTGLPETDALGRDLYPAVPRGWIPVVVGQLIALGGTLVLLGGIASAFLYRRHMTWARASIGALLFVSLMMILFGIVPNEWLTLTQSVWEWTPQKIALTIPSWLVLNNDVSISFAAIKDIVSGTYVIVVLAAIAITMYQWQERQKQTETAPPPKPVSSYGRPITKVER